MSDPVSDSPRSGRPVRIAYLAHGINGKRDGVRAKILAQASAWARLDRGVEVGVFVRCESGGEADWVGQTHVVSARSSRAGILGRLVQRELLSLDLARWKPDLIYLRQGTVSPSVLALVAAVPTVVELNTLNLEELRLGSRLRYYYAVATRNLALRPARGLVAVTDEIARHPSVRRLGRPTAVVPNAIDLATHPALPPTDNTAPHLAFLGAPRLAWHGLDKIGRMACHFPSWTFHVIGPAPDELADHAPNVHVYGPLDPGEYLSILARSDAAIGSLALHRKNMKEASPLKVAEYLARGLPTVIGYIDTRFPSGAPFLLQIPNTEDNVESSLDNINQFVLDWMGRRIDPGAISSIDTLAIERRRLAFMLECLASGPRFRVG